MFSLSMPSTRSRTSVCSTLTCLLYTSFATRMIEAGVDAKSLAMIIGHSDPGFTLKTYVKPDFKYLEKQMRRLLEVRESA